MHLCTCTHNRICTRSHDARKHKHAWHTSGATGGKGRAAGSSGCRGSCTQAADQRTPGTPPRGPSPSRRHRPRSLPLFLSSPLSPSLSFSCLLPLFAYSLNPTLSASLSILLCTHTRMVRACKPVQCLAHRQTHTHTSRKQQGKADLGSEEWVDAQPFWEVINRREFVDQCQRQLNVIQQDLAGTSGPAWENLQVI